MALLFLVGSCGVAPERRETAGRLEVQWTGSDRGKISGPATAEWCAPDRLLEIRSIQGDTGVALALYPSETITAGRYRVVDPVKAESLPPAAGLALRWLTQTTVQGFQGDSGTVDLERSISGQISGQVRARARSVVDTQRVEVTGIFRDLTVRPKRSECATSSGHSGKHAEPSDTGVH
jgi:hypothetical protein